MARGMAAVLPLEQALDAHSHAISALLRETARPAALAASARAAYTAGWSAQGYSRPVGGTTRRADRARGALGAESVARPLTLRT